MESQTNEKKTNINNIYNSSKNFAILVDKTLVQMQSQFIYFI